MPDLMLDGHTIQVQIQEQARDAIERLAEAANNAVASVGKVERALRDLPERADDLLSKAAFAVVDELDIDASNLGGSRQPWVQVGSWSLGIRCNNNEYRVGDSQLRRNVKPGRYRAIVVLLPIP